MGTRVFEFFNFKFFDIDFYRPQRNFFFLARELVRGNPVNFFSREWRRYLRDFTSKLRREFAHVIERECRFLRGGEWPPFGVVGVSGKTEADDALVTFSRCEIKLRQPGHIAKDQRQNASGQRIERAEVADGLLLEDAPHARDNIV